MISASVLRVSVFLAYRLERASEPKAHEERLFARLVLLLMIWLMVMIWLIGVKRIAVAIAIALNSCLVLLMFRFASSDFLMVFFHVFDFSRGFLVRAERSDVSVSWFIPFFVWHNAN